MEYSHLFLEVENKIENASNLGIQADGWSNLRYTLCSCHLKKDLTLSRLVVCHEEKDPFIN